MLLRKYFRRRLYLNSHINDVTLVKNANEWLHKNNYQLNYAGFSNLHKEIGLDLATQILYQYFTEYKQNQFFNLINQIPIVPFQNEKKIIFLIIPGMFYKERPELGSDGALFSQIAGSLGFEVKIVNTKSLGAISENMPIIEEAISALNDREAWLVSLSRGSLEVRAHLQQTALSDRVSGWLNINGSCFGTLLADYQTNTWHKRLSSRILSLVSGIKYKGLSELKTTNPAWAKDFSVPNKMKLIHLVGFPFTSTVTLQVQNRFKRLSQDGPNDGVVLLKDYLRTPGLIYPIWGTDHMMRVPNMATLFYKLCYFIHHQCYKDIHYEKLSCFTVPIDN
jgi:hypothetical protein